MKPAAFAYHAPKTMEDALAILAEVAPQDGRVLAGGQSLVPTMAFRMARPAHLVDINNVEGLDKLLIEEGRLSIGARVRHAAFHQPVAGGPLGQLLSHVVRHIAHYPIRTRGTFCGSLAHADPASEWCLVAATLGAEITARSTRGTRVIPVDEFLDWAMTTTLAEDELLSAVSLPLLPADTKFGFYEFSRRAGDYALSMALVTYRLADGLIVDPRIGIGGAEGRARRIIDAENVLNAQPATIETFRRAADAAAACIDPMEDLQASGDFRRDLVRTVTRRALERAAA